MDLLRKIEKVRKNYTNWTISKAFGRSAFKIQGSSDTSESERGIWSNWK